MIVARQERRLFIVLKLVAVLLIVAPAYSWAQCNCKFTIPAGSGYVNFDGAAKGVKAGDVICVNAGSVQTIQFSNIRGVAGNPVIIKNCGGQVQIGGTSAQNGFLFFSSKYVHLTGTGAAGVQYGFRIAATAAGSQGIAYSGLSSDVEIDHLEIGNTGYSAMMIKTDPSPNCADQSATRPNFTLNNVSIHDNYIHHTGGEGIYLGDSFYLGTTVFCGATQYCHEVRGVRIYNNRFESTGRESIQVGAGVSDIQIYNNSIYNYGTKNNPEQNGGVQLGLGTAARFYNNLIKNGSGPALAIQGIGAEYIYNNVFVNPGSGGAITINTRPTPLSTDIVNKGYAGGVYMINNTFVNAGNGVVQEYINAAPGNVMYNNLVVASAATWDKTYFYTAWNKGNNIVVPVLANAKFANAATDDYRLLTGSPAINAGRDVSVWGVIKDFLNFARPAGVAFDAGAYELAGAPSTPVAPVANAGVDKSITLPTSTLSLTGTATDADGTIASYAWTKVSGGSATLTNANSSTVSLSGLAAGSYIFRLTVTDNASYTDTDDVSVTVAPAAFAAPVANAGADKSITLPTNTLTLVGTATDADGTVVAYAWTKLSGGAATLTNANTSAVALSGLTAGPYVFRLTVRDNANYTDTNDVSVTVNAASSAPVAPVANAGADKSITLPTSTLSLSGSGTDADGTIASYSWTKLSGGSATLSNANTNTVSLSGLTAGPYVFRLTVTDNANYTDIDDVGVTVNAAPAAPVAPIANAGADKTITLPTSTLSLSGSGTDADGTIASYSWTKLSGGPATLSNANTNTVSLSGLAAGSYVFRLTVTDNANYTDNDDVGVTVNSAPAAATVVYRVNAGSPNTVAASPVSWLSDTQSSRSPYVDPGSLNYTCGATSWTGTNTTGAPNEIFGPNRYSPNYGYASQLQWNFPLSSGTYEVNLFFAETPYSGGVKTAGARVFSVKMENNTVLSNFDIYATAGMNAVKKTFTVSVTDGTLDMDFVRATGNPQVNGIEIIRTSSGGGARIAAYTEDDTTLVIDSTAVEDEEVRTAAEESSDGTMDVYPNPFSSEISLGFNTNQKQIAVSLTTLSGHTVYTNLFADASVFTIDLSTLSLPAGMYVMVITTEKGKEYKKVLKQ
jgi:hypothetical protein